jgi:hypothetical protein
VRLVERMTLAPAVCMVCGKGNTPDGRSKQILPAVDLEGDRNWGDSTYICTQCAEKIGGLVGMATPDTVSDLEQTIKKRDREIHELGADLDQKRIKIRRLLARERSVA